MSNMILTSLKEAASELRARRRKGFAQKFGSGRIKKVRAELGLTQKQFAVSVGVSIQTVRTWEQGRSAPGVFSTLMLLAFLESSKLVERA